MTKFFAILAIAAAIGVVTGFVWTAVAGIIGGFLIWVVICGLVYGDTETKKAIGDDATDGVMDLLD